MKIYQLIVCFLTFQIYAQQRAETITLNFKNTPIQEVFEAIQNQTEYTFAYQPNVVESVVISSIQLENKTISAVLSMLQRNTPLRFDMMGVTIAVSKKNSKVKEIKTGSIKGKVFDKDADYILLSGVSVRIVEGNIGSITDGKGLFEIQDLAEGTYTLEISYLGYQTKRIPVQILENNVLTIDIPMHLEVSELDTVVLSSLPKIRYRPVDNSTEESLISTIKESTAIVTGISNEQIAQTPDIDAREVISRVPGVSFLNNFVVVRGMSPRYNMTMLNGMITPSSEMDTRAFSYNLLPSSVIDQILVYKSPSADLPGNFGGGVIKVATKNAAVSRRFDVGYTSFLRTASSLSNFYTYQGSDKDWYGGGVSDRELPDILMNPNYNLPDHRNFPEEIARVGAQLPEVRSPQNGTNDVDFTTFLNYYDSWKIGNIRINNLSFINYESQKQFVIQDFQFNANRFRIDDAGQRAFERAVYSKDSLYTERVRISAMQNFDIAIHKNHHISINTFFTRNANDQLLNRQRDGFAGDPDTKVFSFRYNKRDLFQGQLKGDHVFESHHVDWSVGINRAYDNIPDLQRYSFIQELDTNQQETGNWDIFSTTNEDFNNRISFDTDEEAEVYQLNYIKSFEKGGLLKIGGYYENRNRDFFSRRFRIIPFDEVVNVSDPAPWNNVTPTLYANFTPESGNSALTTAPSPGQYTFDDQILAGYAKVQFPLFNDRLLLEIGTRFEWNERILLDENGDRIERVNETTADGELVEVATPDPIQRFILPSASMSYNLSDDLKIRASAGKTIDRPEYREQSSIEYSDFEANQGVWGNPLLENAEIWNYDVRFEWYPSAAELVSIGTFYKDMDGAIEKYNRNASSAESPTIISRNTDKGTVYGVELEARKSFDFISPKMQELSIILNAAWTKTEVGFDNREQRTLEGAPSYILNTGLYYGLPTATTKMSLLYNVVGQRLRIAPIAGLEGLYELPRHALDFTLTQNITEYLKLRFAVQNILNQPFRFYRDGNGNETYDPEPENAISNDFDTNNYIGDYVEREHKVGRYFSLGLRVTF